MLAESEGEGTPMPATQPRAALAGSPADAPSPIQPRAALADMGGGGTPPNAGIDAPSPREERGAEAPAPSSDDDVAPAPRPASRAYMLGALVLLALMATCMWVVVWLIKGTASGLPRGGNVA